MRMKKVALWVVGILGCVALLGFFAIPTIAEKLLLGKLTDKSSNTVKAVHVSWLGPQTITGLHVEDTFGHADLDVELPSGLFTILSEPYDFIVRGSAVLKTNFDVPNKEATASNSGEPIATKDISTFALPGFSADVRLDTLTIEGDETLIYQNIVGECIVEPGRVFSWKVSAETDMGGSIVCFGDAPDLFTETGELNWDASASAQVTIDNAPIPTINGQGGWTIVSLIGEVSSPKLSEALIVSMLGSFSQYDMPRGAVTIKAQLLSSTDSSDPYAFKGKELVGTIDVQDVPTSILAPLLNKYKIDTARDLGETMEFHLVRSTESSLLQTSFRSEKVFVEGTVDSNNGILTDISLNADVGSDLVQSVTNGEFAGDATVRLFFNRLVPLGWSYDDNKECEGNIVVKGELHHLPSKTSISLVQADFYADLTNRSLSASGIAVLNDTKSTYVASLHSANKNKLHGIEDLWNTIVEQLPRGNGQITMEQLPTTLLQAYVPEEQQQYTSVLGDTFSLHADFVQKEIRTEVASGTTQATGTLMLEGAAVTSLQNCTLKTKLPRELSSSLLGTTITGTTALIADITEIDFEGNASFSATFSIGKQETFVQGKTIRQNKGDRIGELDAHLALTGIDTRLLDAVLNCNGLLADSLGTPVAIEIIATNVLTQPTLLTGGTSPNATFESSLGFFDGKVFTLQDTVTRGDLKLSPKLTQHLLKDLGPVLSDIRSVQHPIQMSVSNANASLDGDVSTLNADVHIVIGEVELDSGSATMKLLPMFNTKHVEIIPAFFEPIHIEIRNGIATYKKFNLTIAGKYSIPYSGTINFVNRKLNIKTAVPLTGLGYSIKELRGLSTDIDVPILITGDD